ncbi:hypothetical protein PRIPAC_96765 [Pristionchus pacificus]|uniref:Uncharacterized protein n=1 Tax=Pristionchus pacificus TaxID=54126 RepID=A0A2A6B329_PRIPA|nr:hypothetical protein PRIPAC_96765 [Pristionchus pacificus]|eukprot:PDM60287.1 hypothetical protein PRIPAC_54112 [Pristionchus pacificus]
MRKVSKVTKNLVDSSILNVRKTDIWFEVDSENLHVTMKTIELEKFLAYMKPRTRGVQIKEIYFPCLRSEIIRMCSHFCEDRRCTELHICDVTHVLSQNEVETLLKIFHTMAKKVAFAGYAIHHHSNVVHSKVGAYQIQYSRYGGPRTGGLEISIKHLDLEGFGFHREV